MKLVAILRFIRRSTLLITVGLVGGTVTTAGVVMLVTPGPGLVVIIAGLAILATQFAWAERALDKVKQQAIAARDKASARRTVRRDARAEAAAAAAPSETPPAGYQEIDDRVAEGAAPEGRSLGAAAGDLATESDQATG